MWQYFLDNAIWFGVVVTIDVLALAFLWLVLRRRNEMPEDNDDMRATRSTPPGNDQDWQYIWAASEKAHRAWPVVKVLLALFGNWKVIGVGLFAGLALGGQELLIALGVWK